MEFLRYPHLIHHLFNGGWFGPPWRFTATSTWTWIGHPVSGHMKQTVRPIKTWFPFGCGPEDLNLACSIYSPDRSTKSTRSPIDGLSVLVSTGFQVLFHSPPGVLFTFPSQYYTLSVTEEYSALRGGPRFFLQGFSCLVVLRILPCIIIFRLRGFHPLWPVFPGPFC